MAKLISLHGKLPAGEIFPQWGLYAGFGGEISFRRLLYEYTAIGMRIWLAT
jgi:hypothetical protein